MKAEAQVVPAEAVVPTMLPRNERLIEGVRAALQKLRGQIADEQSLFELTSLDFMLSELMLREDMAFFVDFQRRSRQLAEEGVALLAGSKGEPAVAGLRSRVAALEQVLAPDLRFDVVAQHINAAMRCLESVIEGLCASEAPEARDMRHKIAAHEHALHQHRMQAPTVAPPEFSGAGRIHITPQRLENYLRERFPDVADLRVTSFKQLVGGYQKTTVLFDTEDADGRTESLVLRAEKSVERFLVYEPGEIHKEYRIVQFVHAKGVPVAEPLWLETDAARLGQRFFVSRKVPGENYGTAIAAKTITEPVARSFIATMAQLHSLPVTAEMRDLPLGRWSGFASMRENTLAYVDYWRHQPWMAQAEPSPITARLYTWLLDNVPEDDDTQCLVHCDFGPHNILVHEEQVSGVLDWESARIGDAAEDIICFLQSCRGQVDFDAVRAWYQEATGRRISAYRLRYFDVQRYFIQMIAAWSAASMYEHLDQAGPEWCNFPLRWVTHSTGVIEEKIALAEQARKTS